LDGLAFGDDGEHAQPAVALRTFENVHGETAACTAQSTRGCTA
jgi:hypothetical protein